MDTPEDDPDIFALPRYRENPEVLFIELYVTDTVSPLPDFAVEWIADRLRCTRDNWRDVIRKASRLSETFDIAVLDLWYRNSAIALAQGFELDPRDYAKMFADNWYAPNSQIDVWGPGALEDAIERVEAAQAREDRRQ
jgi:hypothetical protein